MKPVVTLALLLLITTPGLACPQRTAEAALENTDATSEASSDAPAETTTGEDQSAEDGADPGDDVMKKFTRHRPGACPEGPPCKVED